MKKKANSRLPLIRGHSRGFSLIELLVVCAVIAILAGILLPTVAIMRQRVKEKLAKTDLANLGAAIQRYTTEYSRPPVSQEAENSAAGNRDCPDFTYGTTHADGSLLNPGYPQIKSYGNPAYQACNAELIALLRPASMTAIPALAALAQKRNSREQVFYEPEIATGVNTRRLGNDGVLRDPWGNPYIITLDINQDNRCVDGLYASLRKGSSPRLPPEITGAVIAWSLGRDGQATADAKVGAKGGVNKDNLVSWE